MAIQLEREHCGYLITDLETGQELFIQSDWDFPGVARTFGWSMKVGHKRCRHDRTDGTIDCPDCGTTASTFIAAASDWLDDNNGATAEDPGYFG